MRLFIRIETVLLPAFATARSSLLSPLRSPMTTDFGFVAVGYSTFAAKIPLPLPSKTETVSLPGFATTRSCLLSPLMSPMATDMGRKPVT